MFDEVKIRLVDHLDKAVEEAIASGVDRQELADWFSSIADMLTESALDGS